MPADLPDKARRSRITAACAVCRTKRQKCSGSKPVCDQCQHNNEQCWWSDQKKRGPAKDYLRSLQDRLQETERLLLGVLDKTSDDQLEAVLHREEAAPSHHAWTTSHSGQEFWSRLPLTNLMSVREWQAERHSSQPPALSETTGLLEHVTNFVRPPASLDPLLSDSAPGIPGAHLHSATASLKRPTNGLQQMTYQEPVSKSSLERRYSDETRDVAKTLFSISHNGDNLKRKRGLSDYDPGQDEALSSHSSQTPEEASTKFPKHLFW